MFKAKTRAHFLNHYTYAVNTCVYMYTYMYIYTHIYVCVYTVSTRPVQHFRRLGQLLIYACEFLRSQSSLQLHLHFLGIHNVSDASFSGCFNEREGQISQCLFLLNAVQDDIYVFFLWLGCLGFLLLSEQKLPFFGFLEHHLFHIALHVIFDF